jgi:hypothetical protein
MRANVGNRRVRTWQRLGLITAAAALAMSVVGGGTASATTPAWSVGYGDSYLASPAPTTGASSASVSAGARVGFFVWLHNGDTSNISQLFLNAATTPTATVFGAQWTIKDVLDTTVVRSGTCPNATPLACSFGALNSGQTVYVVAAYTLASNLSDGATQSVTFDFNTTGTPPDKNDKSHGDLNSISDSIMVTRNGDAAGDFNFNQASLTVADNQKVNGNNQQATSATFAQVLTGAAVGDSPSLTIPCDATLLPGFDCQSLTSLVSAVEVGHGKTFNNTSGGPGIKVVVIFSQSPKQLSGTSPFVYHYWEDATGAHAQLITEACTYDSNNLPTNTNPAGCLTVSNKMATVWVFHNGKFQY